METLKLVIGNLAFILLLAAFLEMLLPNSSMRGFVRLIMGFFVIAAVLQPITSLLRMPVDEVFRPWTQIISQAPAVVPDGQSANPGKDVVREQYRRILQSQVRSVAESAASVVKAEVRVELGRDGDGYLDYPPIVRIDVDLYKSAATVVEVDPVVRVEVIGGEGDGGDGGESSKPVSESLTDLERMVRDKVAEALQVPRDVVVVKEK
ncbi:MAG: stage III sporulation protein AF [Peptococcaceae bacterium]|jgi:stage III sporulation protein AF|nr:stage III sporulation protein AF [Peptococcaceae bacterium]